MQITSKDIDQQQPRAPAALEIGSPVRRGKLTRGNFTPNSYRLAKLGKSMARHSIALNNAFPDDKDFFLWNGISKSAANDAKLADAIRRAAADDSQKEKLIKYVSVVKWIYLFSF